MPVSVSIESTSLAMKLALCALLAVGAASSACGSDNPTTPTPPTTTTPTVVPVSVVVSGEGVLTGPRQRTQLTAVATLSDDTTVDVTKLATWKTSDPAVAVVTSAGVITTLAPGDVVLTLTYQNVSTTFGLTVANITTSFEGTIKSNDGQTGTFSLTLQGAVVSAAAPTSAQLSGSVRGLSSAPTAVTGLYEAVTGAVTLSSAEITLRLSGTIVGPIMSGTYTGAPGVVGTFSGVVSGVK